MDKEKLCEQLKIDEGCIYEVYKDHLGYPTFGIGHLITENDPEFEQPVGTPVSSERVLVAFEQDIKTVISDCCKLLDNFYAYPEEVKQIVANMMFNLGYTRLSKFRNFKAALEAREWNRAADEMVDSRWYRQVGKRAERLVERMRNV